MPSNAQFGKYRLRLEGSLNSDSSGTIFMNETEIEFSSKQASLFIQMSQPIYRQEQKGSSVSCDYLWVCKLQRNIVLSKKCRLCGTFSLTVRFETAGYLRIGDIRTLYQENNFKTI